MVNARRLIGATPFAVIFAAFSGFAWAQWPLYATKNVLTTKDGKPDLNGPVPRASDGKPDLTGIWGAARRTGGGQRGAASGAAIPQPNQRPDARPEEQASADGGPPPATFFNIGAGFKEGLPLTPWAAEVRRQRESTHAKDNPDAHCLPIGLMQLHLHPQPRKIIQTPGVIVILYEAQGETRQIFTDGRPIPNNDPQPWWRGYSSGHWEGDTLVVETVGFRDDVWLDVNGSPLTGAGKMTERFRRPDYGNLQIDITIEDPKAYTKPFTVRVNQRVMLDTDLIEFVCNENERSSPFYSDK